MAQFPGWTSEGGMPWGAVVVSSVEGKTAGESAEGRRAIQGVELETG